MKQWCTRTTDHCRSEVFAKADDGLRTCGSSGEMRPLVEPKWQDQPELGAGTLHPFFFGGECSYRCRKVPEIGGERSNSLISSVFSVKWEAVLSVVEELWRRKGCSRWESEFSRESLLLGPF